VDEDINLGKELSKQEEFPQLRSTKLQITFLTAICPAQ